jgi:hypothetical protein
VLIGDERVSDARQRADVLIDEIVHGKFPAYAEASKCRGCDLRGVTPPTILDYIVVHELVHLIYPNHTEAFWNEVDKVMPDFRDRKEWLRMHGAGMNL